MLTQDYFGAFKALLPDELRTILERDGMRIVRISGLGSLANLCGKETVERVLSNDGLFQEFLELASVSTKRYCQQDRERGNERG